MRNLPAPLGEIEIPATFNVTAIAAHQGCDLKMLASAKTYAPFKLPAGPDAAIGLLIHEALEAALKTEEPASDLFERCVAEMHAELSQNEEKAHFANLSKARSNMEWRNIRATTIAKIESLRADRALNRTTSAVPLQARKFGTEVKLVSSSLRLSGRSDRIRKSEAGAITITDFKTGQVFGPDGAILESIRRQLFLYALLAEQVVPEVEIKLTVESPVGRFHLEWNEESRAQMSATMTGISARLPSGVTLRASETARPGDECRRCAIRPSCTAYIKAAPSWWSDLPADMTALPADTWGRLVSTKTVSEGITIEIRDDAGRRVKISGLRNHSGVELASPGVRIFAFSLEASGGGKGWDGTRFHPHTFHEIPPDRHSRRAWSATLFSQPGL